MSEHEIAPEAEAEAPVVRPQGRPIESRFLYVDVAAARAKQLRKGAKVRLDAGTARAVKPERLAMEEVNHQLVEWDLPEFAVLLEKR
ncbi:MAG: DNA-directed RNA polymerase subunit omega [Vicinamibacterales bacterium]